MDDKKLRESAELFNRALKALHSAPKDPLVFASASKCYEVAFEYAWKHFKRQADQAGLEVYSPRDSIKAAAQLNIVDDPEQWNKFLGARNLSVHDYLGISDAEFLLVMEDFDRALTKLCGALPKRLSGS